MTKSSDDIYAVMDAGAEAGVLDRGEQQMMENVFGNPFL